MSASCECARRPGGRLVRRGHDGGCPDAGKKSGPSGAHKAPRVKVPAATGEACVALGIFLGCTWQDAPAEALQRLRERS